MNYNIQSLILTAINSNVVSITPISGGSIASAFRAELDDKRSLFVKVSPQHNDMFVKEANGLRELKKANSIRIPEVLFANEEILFTEYLPVSSPTHRTQFFETFGRQFARLHRFSSETFGFHEDNYIGSTPQINLPQIRSWKEFFFVNRLEYQFRLAEKNGHGDREFVSLFHRLENNIEVLIPDDGEPPALLHGDLWSGNYLCTDNNIPAIIDPAVYYGHREADLGMTMLFGGFGERFYTAYNEEYPLNEGWERRMELYKLYHLFNHLNLFGEGYYSQVCETMNLLV